MFVQKVSLTELIFEQTSETEPTTKNVFKEKHPPSLHLPHPLRAPKGHQQGGKRGRGAASHQTLHLPHGPQWDQQQGEVGGVGGNRNLGERERGGKCTPGLLLYLSLSSITPSQSVSPKQRPVSGRYRERMDRDREASH